MTSIANWFSWAWATFNNASPIANFLQITQALGWTVIFVGGTLIVWFRRRQKHKDTEIANLKKDVAHREETSQAAGARAEKAEDRVKELEDRFASSALAKAEREWRDKNENKAQNELDIWLEREGEPIACVLVHRANWALARAVGELRDDALAVAEGYANAAVVFDKHNKDALALIRDVTALRLAEDHIFPTFTAALATLQESDTKTLFDADIVTQGLAAQSEANGLREQGRHHVAMNAIDRAIPMLQQQLGAKARLTLSARRDRAFILLLNGHPEMALAEIQNIISTREQNRMEQLEALYDHYILAYTFDFLGKDEEALPVTQEIVAAHEAHPLLGAEHSNTLASRYLLARILANVDKADEALPIIKQVIIAQKTHPLLGPDHPNTLKSRQLLAQVLAQLGEVKESLPVIKQCMAAQKAHPALGAEHPDTLLSSQLLAQALNSLGNCKEALPIIQQVVATNETHPAFGPEHPVTLNSRYLLAEVFDNLGKAMKALPIIQQVVEAQEAHPALGPASPFTLKSYRLLTNVLQHVNTTKSNSSELI